MTIATRLGLLLGLLLALTVSSAALAEVAIGVGAPLSGPEAIFGNQIRIGVEQAIADANASGGLLGQKARLVPGDDRGDAKRAVEVAKDFVRQTIPFVIGHFSSATTVPTSSIYADVGILNITPSAIAPIVTDRGLKTVFRTCGREDDQAGVAARYLTTHFTRIAIIHDRTTTGKALADSLRERLASGGQRDVFYGGIDKGTRDDASLVARLKVSGAQVVFWSGTQTEAGLLGRQLRESGAKIVLMGGLGIASDDFASLADGAAEGTLMVFPRDPRRNPAAADLLKRLQTKDIQPDGTFFYAYAAVEIIRQAAQAAGSLDPKTLAATIHSGMTFKTVLGDLTFDAKGDPTVSDFVVYVWHKGPSGRMAYDDLAAG